MSYSLECALLFFSAAATPDFYTLSLHDALPILIEVLFMKRSSTIFLQVVIVLMGIGALALLLRSEEHTSELQSRRDLVCRLLLEKKNCVICLTQPFPLFLAIP